MRLVMAAKPSISRGRARTLRACSAFASALVVSSSARRRSGSGERGQGAGLHRHRGNAEPGDRDGGERAAGARHRRRLHGRRRPPTRRRSTRRTSPATARSSSSTRPATCSTRPRKPICSPTSRAAAASSASARRRSSRRAAAAFFDTLIGLTGASRTTAASAVERAGRRVPRPRAPGDARPPGARPGRTPTTTTQWTNNPTGTVHTVARVRFNTIPTAGGGRDPSPTTRSRASPAATDTLQPQQERALSWCRDVQQGRSFYTGMGQRVGRVRRDAEHAPRRRRPVGGGHGPRRLQGDDHLELHQRRASPRRTRRCRRSR